MPFKFFRDWIDLYGFYQKEIILHRSPRVRNMSMLERRVPLWASLLDVMRLRRRALNLGTARQIIIKSKNDKPRTVVLLDNSADQARCRWLTSKIMQQTANLWSASCYNRAGYGHHKAIHAFREYLDQVFLDGEALYVWQTDIADFTSSFNLHPSEPVWEILVKHSKLPASLLAQALLPSTILDINGQIATSGERLAGLPSSSLLSLAALYSLDREINAGYSKIFYARFVDDILIAAPRLQALQPAMDFISTELPRLGFSIKPAKTHLSHLTRDTTSAGEGGGHTCVEWLGVSINAFGQIGLTQARKADLSDQILNRFRTVLYKRGCIKCRRRFQTVVNTSWNMLFGPRAFLMRGIKLKILDPGFLSSIAEYVHQQIIEQGAKILSGENSSSDTTEIKSSLSKCCPSAQDVLRALKHHL